MTTIPQKAPIVLLTRPSAASGQFADALHPWPGLIITAPLLEIVRVDTPSPVPRPAAVIFTSKNALLHYRGPIGIPAYCVGTATTQAAVAKGLLAQRLGADARELIAALSQMKPAQPLVHVRGHHVARPIADDLRRADVPCLEWIVYDQIALPLTSEAQAAVQSQRPMIVPVFSPRSATLLMQALAECADRAPHVFVTISDAVATRVKDFNPNAQIFTAARPDASAMVEAVHASARHLHPLEGKPTLP